MKCNNMPEGKAMKILYALLLFSKLFAIDSVMARAGDTDNWQLVLAEDPFSSQTACLLVSAEKQSDDGQATTAVSLVYNGNLFMAKTESNIDLSYADLGLQVGNKKPHTIDRLHRKTSAVFETQAPQIRDEFIKGLKASLRLGFWPSWPTTRSYVIEFDLRGFTQAYEAFVQCQKTGEIP